MNIDLKKYYTNKYQSWIEYYNHIDPTVQYTNIDKEYARQQIKILKAEITRLNIIVSKY